MSHFRRSTEFWPSGFSYGDGMPVSVDVDVSAGAPAPAPTSGQDYTQYASLARDVLFGKTAQEEAAILEEKIKNYRQMSKSSSGIIKNFYLNEINKMQARLGVLKSQAATEKFSSDLSTATRVLTVGAVAVGIVILLGVAMNQVQSARIKQAELKRLV